MDEIKETGGARIGNANATWPFATLIVNKNELELKAGIIGNLVFKPSDVTSIERYVQIPLIGQGLKINHSVSGYNPKVIFWTMGNITELLRRIEQTGFLAHTNPLPAEISSEIAATQSGGAFPLKIPAAIAIVVIWNILFLTDMLKMFSGHNTGMPLGLGAQLALAFVFITGLLLLISAPFRALMLKPGRTIADIRPFIYFLMFICGIIFLAITFMPK